MASRVLKARYKTVGPTKTVLSYTHCWMDENKALQQETRTKEVNTWMVYMPQGHSIRVRKDELIRLGFHLKPRIVDMLTGDIIDLGGDPYDLDVPTGDDNSINILGDDEADDATSSKKGK